MQFVNFTSKTQRATKVFSYSIILLTPSIFFNDQQNIKPSVSQYVYENKPLKINNEIKQIKYSKNILLTDIFPDSSDFTQDEELIYSTAAEEYYGDACENTSLFSLYYG